MEDNRKYINLTKAVMASGVSLFVVYAMNLVLTPYIIKSVGTESYGYLALAKQFTQYVAIITAAINSFAVRYISIEYNKESYDSANRYLSSSFYSNVFLAVLIIFFLGIGFLIIKYFNVMPEISKYDIELMFFLVFINFIISNLFIPFSAAAYIAHKLQVVSICTAIGGVFEGAVAFILLKLFQGHIYFVALAMVINTVIIAAADYFIYRRYTPHLRVDYRKYDFSAIKELLMGGVWTSVNSIGEVLNHGLDLLVCNIMLTSTQMGQLAIAKLIQSMFQKGYALFDKPFQPIFLKYYSLGDRKQLLDEFRLAMKLSATVTNVGFAGIWALGMPFFAIWLPGQDTRLLYKLTVITIMTIIPGGSMHPLYYIYTLTVKQKIPSIVTILGGCFNVLGMIVAIRYTDLGVYAVAWTTVIVMFAINFITNPLYMAHVMGYKWHVFYPSIIKNIYSEILIMVVFYVMSMILAPKSFFGIGGCALIFIILGTAVHFMVVFSRDERRRVSALLKR